MKKNNLKVKTKLMINVGILLILLLLIAVSSYVGINRINQFMTLSDVNHNLMIMLKSREINHLDWINTVLKSVSNDTIATVNVESDPHKCSFGKWYYSDDRKEAEKIMPDIKAHLLDIEIPHKNLHESVIKLKEISKNNPDKAIILNIFENETMLNASKLREVFAKINDVTESNINVKLLVIILSLLSVIFGLFSGIYVLKSIIKQLGNEPDKLIEITSAIAGGDFTVVIDTKENDTSSVTYYSKKMKDELEGLIIEIIGSIESLNDVISQIADGNQSLSQRTSEQASSLEEIASTIEQATSSIKQNSDSSKIAFETSSRSTKLADEGNDIVEKAVDSIGEINISSNKIGEIISVINDIAFQTNLLALNAAVEAARAGEQGRGFAVVAGEVRNLAQRSANASKEIAELIKNSVNKVNIGTELVNNSGKSLKDIVVSIRKVNTLVSEIKASTDEQQQGMDQINLAISELDTMTQQNAALVEQTASASEEMSNQAKELLTKVEKFKVGKGKML